MLFDDRDVSMGVKFKDADLIGFYFQLVVGKLFKQTRQYELVNRFKDEKKILNRLELLEYLKQTICHR